MSTQPSFYWHDYETFGLSREERFPAQFAGIRTDLEMNPCGEGEVLYCRPAPDMLPAPDSCLLTGILPQYCEEHGLPEHQFAMEVFQRLSVPGTIGIGYNSIAFDDEVTRFLFWRNFLPPYAREFRSECGRWDLYPVVLACWALRSDGIRWPLRKDWADRLNGKRILPNQREGKSEHVFKLECLSAENGLLHAKAHDALSDVEATVALARLIARKKPDFWGWALKNRGKRQVSDALNRGPVIWVTPQAHEGRGYIRVVRAIGGVPGNPNCSLVWDLTQDPEALFSMSEDELRRATGWNASGDAVHRLYVNRSPFVCPYLKVLSAERAEKFGIDLAKIAEHEAKFSSERLAWVRASISGALADEEEPREPEDADVALYSSGFPGPADERMISRIPGLDGEEIADGLAAGRIHFEKPVYSELLFRYRARNFPESLTAGELAAWKESVSARLSGRLPAYDARLDAYERELDERAAPLLEKLRQWRNRFD